MTDQTLAYVGNEADPTSRALKLEPTPGGTLVRIVEFGPEGDWVTQLDAQGAREASTNLNGKAKHRKRSANYALLSVS